MVASGRHAFQGGSSAKDIRDQTIRVSTCSPWSIRWVSPSGPWGPVPGVLTLPKWPHRRSCKSSSYTTVWLFHSNATSNFIHTLACITPTRPLQVT